MKFKTDLNDNLKSKVDECDQRLTDPKRLAALARTRLMDTPQEEAFDRLARLAAEILRVPLTIISLVGDRKQFFKAGYGLPAPYDEVREVPIDASICRYTLAGQDIIVADSSKDELFRNHPTTEPWGITAFLAIPMTMADGLVLGAFCAVDTVIRNWTEQELRMMRELTASVMTEIQLRIQIEELATERQLREQFVATLTHDLLNPIGVAKGSAEILQEEIPQDDLHHKLLRMITENMKHAEFMIRDLLNVTSVKAGQAIIPHLVECDFSEIVQQTAEGLQQMHGALLTIKGSGYIPGRWDAVMVRRIIENLVGNAFKYGEKGMPVTVDYGLVPTGVFLSVNNRGNPIPENLLKQIFEPFARSESARRGDEKGWGLGLTLVKAFTEAQNGIVKIESGIGQGTTFSIILPRDL